MGNPYSDRTFWRFDPEALRGVVHQSYIEHRLLGAGKLEMRVRNRIGPQFAVDAGDYGCAVYARGVLPAQAVTIGLAPIRSGEVFTNGRALPAEGLQVFAEAASIDYVTTHGASWRAVTVTRDHLQAHAIRRLGRELVLPASDSEQFEPDPVMTWQLVEQIEAGFRLAADPGTDPGTMLLCDIGLLDALTEALAHGPGTPEPRGARTRRRILGAVESVVRRGAPSAVVDGAALSRRCAASERLVEQAMRYGAGMPPKRWLTMARLNRVYEELSDPGGTRSVTDTALHWGFNHLGRFASNYRTVFGESPSDTVARVRGPQRARVTSLGAVPAA